MFTFAFLICFLSAALFSGVWITIHANHHHTHTADSHNCATCALIQSAENLLKQSGLAAILTALTLTGPWTGLMALLVPASLWAFQTPVSLKIRMNH
jgi:hypothetical protein